MNSRIWCVCAMAILLVSTAALADIVTSGQGWTYSAGGDPEGEECSPTSYSPSASAGGESEESAWDWETASGWYSKRTTQAGNFTWSYSLSGYAHASVDLSDEFESCCGGASVSASGSGPNESDSLSASAYADSGMFQGQYYISDRDVPDDEWASWSGWYAADTSVSTSYDCDAYAGVTLYSNDGAGGDSSVTATCNMY